MPYLASFFDAMSGVKNEQFFSGSHLRIYSIMWEALNPYTWFTMVLQDIIKVSYSVGGPLQEALIETWTTLQDIIKVGYWVYSQVCTRQKLFIFDARHGVKKRCQTWHRIINAIGLLDAILGIVFWRHVWRQKWTVFFGFTLANILYTGTCLTISCNLIISYQPKCMNNTSCVTIISGNSLAKWLRA